MRVLVVEDDRALGEVVRRGLVEEGYSVDLAASVVAADDAVRMNRYDLVVLDLGLPDGDGVSLCRKLRGDGMAVPILMLTARDGTWDKVGGLDAGADDYLTKPFDFPELCARLRALSRRPADALPAALDIGGLRLDSATHQVWAGSSAVPLTLKEFSVLELLMRRAGQVVSRADLMEGAWDAHYDGLSNVLDVCIAGLRRKLDDHRVPGIETVRGVGYRLVVPSVVSP